MLTTLSSLLVPRVPELPMRQGRTAGDDERLRTCLCLAGAFLAPSCFQGHDYDSVICDPRRRKAMSELHCVVSCPDTRSGQHCRAAAVLDRQAADGRWLLDGAGCTMRKILIGQTQSMVDRPSTRQHHVQATNAAQEPRSIHGMPGCGLETWCVVAALSDTATSKSW